MSETPFNWSDFIDDTNELSLAAVGAWIKCLHKMRKSVTRGRISMPIEGYARMFGSSVDQAQRVVDEIAEFGVGNAETCEGKITLINRRMYRESNLDSKPSNGNDLAKVPQTSPNLTYISSSSLSSSLGKKEDKEGRKKEICEVFAFWQTHLDHPQAKLTVERHKFIGSRLGEGYSVDDLKAAIRGCKNSPHHMGRNDHGKIYDGIDLIFRNGSKVEQFIGYLKTVPKTPDVGKSTVDTVDPNCQTCNDLGQITQKPGDAKYEWQVEFIPCPDCQAVRLAS
jgi:hypothetical protein